MYDVNSKDFKAKFQKSKLAVKQWEKQFIKENGRQPTKADIKASDKKLQGYYKLYYNLKTMLLDEEILGTPKQAQTKVSVPDSTAIESNITLNPEAIKNTSDMLKENLLPQKEVLEQVENNTTESPWGDHLNKPKFQSSILKREESCLRVSQKLFEGSKFKKRNPRKSLPFSKSKSNLSLISCEDGNSTIDSIDSIDESLTVAKPLPDPIEESLNQLFSVENDCSPKIKALITSKSAISPLFCSSDKVKIVEEKTVSSHQPVSLITKLVSEPTKVMNSIRKLDVKWLDRCCPQESKARLFNDSGFGSVGSSPQLNSTDVQDDGKFSSENDNIINAHDNNEFDEDDELIGGSDNELDESVKSRFSFGLTQKRKSEIFESAAVGSSPDPSRCADYSNADIVPTLKKIKLDSCVEINISEVENNSQTSLLKSASVLKKETLERKIKTGNLNDNFVKINIKKKVFARGKKNFNYSKHKKQQWKKKKKGDGEVGGIIHCFKCGDEGHFARYCQKVFKDKLLSDDENELEDDDTLPTLEEAESLAQETASKLHLKKKNVLTVPSMPQEEEIFEEKRVVEPLYPLNEDGSLIETPPEVFDTLNKFGHYKFRVGQEDAVMRILSGKSTLVTMSTGSGKSLCYQLPAYLYAKRSTCVTLVVSPLVSLMEDQVLGSSSFFKVGCLHANQTPKQREQVLEDVKDGKLFALLVSPETIAAQESSGLGPIFKQLPPIAFACIDEVHCVSQWSHNFRPSYLMLCQVLKEKMGVRTILGLTATANKTTIASIVKELGVFDTGGVIKDIPLPDNLCLSISSDVNKDVALLELLKSPRFRDSNATLIYCTRRDECERLAVLIRTIQNDFSVPVKGKNRISWNAESYHAGMSSSRRKQVQKAFMAGNLRIVVATVAFGMGINKQDIRAVIHYNMPKDFESYVQEVGRAGRDGQLAHCHLFLDSKGCDQNELKRHIYSDSVDRHVIRKLLQRVFSECKCSSRMETCPGHEVAFDRNDTIQALDIPEESILTLLCYLELHPRKLIKVLTPVYINCRIQSYKGVKAINAAAKKCPPLAVACAMNGKIQSSMTFDVVELSRTINWDSGVVKNHLKKLEWDKTKADTWKKSGIAVDFSGLGFRVCSRGDMSPAELDEALEYLVRRVEDQEKRATLQLSIVSSALSHFSFSKFEDCSEDYNKSKSDHLKNVIRKYFETEELLEGIPVKVFQDDNFDEAVVAADVRTLVCNYRDNNFNGRAVARIFHGIQSPNYPAMLWYKCPFWRRHLDKNFNKITRIATIEILRLK